MKTQQAFVRARLPSGKWVNADVLDLTQESFNALTAEMFKRAGVLVCIKDEFCEGKEVPMEIKPEKLAEYEKE